MLLSALGIFMVVDHHTWTTFHFFGDYIPYNSFFMPMFVFISGYFNKVDSSTKLTSYAWKKIKTLLVPFVGISVCVFLLQQLINWYKAGEVTSVSLWYLKYVLGRIVTVGSFAPIAEPTWFVLALFSVLLIYAVLKKFLYGLWNSYVALAIFCIFHILAVYLAKNVLPESSEYILLPLKCMFFLPFLELGILYRDHLEKKHESLSGGCKIALIFGLLLINAFRTIYLPNAYDVAFDGINEMAGFTSPYLITPLVSSVIGILFWLTLVDLIGKPAYESKFVNYMSCNTFWIMGFHVVFFNVLNCILLFLIHCGIDLPYFNVEAFQGTEWYYWEISPNVKLLYLMVGILGPLALKRLYDGMLFVIGKARNNHK
ncbi:MAG: acyltransferase family protein [Lachnospiraceae bacterium]|nr:acyltransferase family protein [Lachnospiraceae bacterium]